MSQLRGEGDDVEERGPVGDEDVVGDDDVLRVMTFSELVSRYMRFARVRSWAAFVRLVQRQLMIEAHTAMRSGMYQ